MKITFFIDELGKRFSAENSNHISLANYIIENNEDLKREFLKSGKQSSIEFLMRDKKFMAGVEEIEKKRKELTYDSEIISKIQKKWIEYYRNKEYVLLDLFELRKRMKEGNLDRGEY